MLRSNIVSDNASTFIDGVACFAIVILPHLSDVICLLEVLRKL